MAHLAQNAVVSTHPPPPKRFYHNCATNRPTPPPPPTAGTYKMFGRVYTTDDVQQTLKEANRDELFDPSAPPLTELRRLNTLLLNLFLKLVDSLCTASALTVNQDGMEVGPHDDLAREIDNVLINMQFLLNSIRPTQAAHDLRALLVKQTAARRNMVERLRAAERKSWDLVAEAADKLAEQADSLPPDSAAAAAIARAAVAAAPSARNRPGADGSAAASADAFGMAGSGDQATAPGSGAANGSSIAEGRGEHEGVKRRRAGTDDNDDSAERGDDDSGQNEGEEEADDEGLVPMPTRPPPEQLAAQLAHIMSDPSL